MIDFIHRLLRSNKTSNESIKIYTIIDSEGNKEYIMTSKSKKDLLNDLDKLAYVYEKTCTI